jgi:4-hydroxy-tetrahydrodipicolinate reductase
MTPIKVAVHGALGKVGKEVVKAINLDPGTMLVGAIDIKATENHIAVPDSNVSVPLSTSLEEIIHGTRPDVIVDFTIAKAAVLAIRTAIKNKVHLVVGTTGFSKDELAEIDRMAKENGVGVVIAANFAIGAVLMMHMAKIAAKYFDYAEIIELHHHLKADAPSGTSLATARGMAQSRGKPFQVTPGPARGEQVEGIPIHSVRLPGLMAHQEVLLGTSGQTLTIRHDTISRECYMPGVMLAVKEVINRKGLIFGLDNLLGL